MLHKTIEQMAATVVRISQSELMAPFRQPTYAKTLGQIEADEPQLRPLALQRQESM